MIELSVTDSQILTWVSGFAMCAHKDQKRRYNGEPFYNHPKRVCETLVEHGYADVEVLAAAMLHDVVEDTNVTLDEIREYFGERVADMVNWLTKGDYSAVVNMAGNPLNRAEKKELEAIRLYAAPLIVKAIKLADRLDNMSILDDDPDFAPTWAAETRHLLDYALKDGDATLWNLVDAKVKNFYAKTLDTVAK